MLNFVCVSCALPQTKFNKAFKPYWGEALQSLSKEKKISMREWEKAGRPRDQENTAYIRYKEAKRNFRREQRAKICDYEKECLQKIAESQDLDQRFFWHMVNKHKKKGSISPILNDSGIMLIEPDDIRREWNDYYRKLYTEEEDDHFDNGFRKVVIEELANIDYKGKVQLDGGPITVEETRAQLKEIWEE